MCPSPLWIKPLRSQSKSLVRIPKTVFFSFYFYAFFDWKKRKISNHCVAAGCFSWIQLYSRPMNVPANLKRFVQQLCSPWVHVKTGPHLPACSQCVLGEVVLFTSAKHYPAHLERNPPEQWHPDPRTWTWIHGYWFARRACWLTCSASYRMPVVLVG